MIKNIKAKELNYNLEQERYLDELAFELSDYEGMDLENIVELYDMFKNYDIFQIDHYLRDYQDIVLKDLDELKYFSFVLLLNFQKLIAKEENKRLKLKEEELKNEILEIEVSI